MLFRSECLASLLRLVVHLPLKVFSGGSAELVEVYLFAVEHCNTACLSEAGPTFRAEEPKRPSEVNVVGLVEVDDRFVLVDLAPELNEVVNEVTEASALDLNLHCPLLFTERRKELVSFWLCQLGFVVVGLTLKVRVLCVLSLELANLPLDFLACFTLYNRSSGSEQHTDVLDTHATSKSCVAHLREAAVEVLNRILNL